MLVKKESVGFLSFMALFNDCLFSEPDKVDNCPDDPFTVSDADTLLLATPYCRLPPTADIDQKIVILDDIEQIAVLVNRQSL